MRVEIHPSHSISNQLADTPECDDCGSRGRNLRSPCRPDKIYKIGEGRIIIVADTPEKGLPI